MYFFNVYHDYVMYLKQELLAILFRKYYSMIYYNYLQVYIHTEENVLIQVNPKFRCPRTFERFEMLMGE